MKYQVIVGNIGNVYQGNNYKEALSVYREYVEQSKSEYGRASGESVSLIQDCYVIKEYIPKIQTPSIKELQKELTRLKQHIDEDFRASDADDKPSIEVTLACDSTGYALQVGDNSFHGSAYSFRHWGVNTLYRNSNCTDLAKDLIDQVRDLAAQ